MGFYILSIVLLFMLYACIYGVKWALKNIEFSENPKIQRIVEVVIKAAIWVLWGLFIYVALTTLGILLSPLFSRINAAFSTAVSAFFTFLDNLIPWAVLVGIGVAWWKSAHPKSPIVDAGAVNPVEVEYAAQEAEEAHGDLAELTYNAVVDTSENTPLTRPRDALSIETGREKPYYMDGIMAVHQFSVDVSAPLKKADEDLVIRELQRHTNQRGKRYSALLRDGHAPIILDVKNSGNFVTVEVILYSDKYKDKIEARRKARIARQQNQGDTYDRDF